MCKVISMDPFDINDFEFWNGAKDNFKDLQKYNLEDLFESYVNECFDELTETEINDLLWFEFEYFLMDYADSIPSELLEKFEIDTEAARKGKLKKVSKYKRTMPFRKTSIYRTPIRMSNKCKRLKRA